MTNISRRLRTATKIRNTEIIVQIVQVKISRRRPLRISLKNYPLVFGCAPQRTLTRRQTAHKTLKTAQRLQTSFSKVLDVVKRNVVFKRDVYEL